MRSKNRAEGEPRHYAEKKYKSHHSLATYLLTVVVEGDIETWASQTLATQTEVKFSHTAVISGVGSDPIEPGLF